MDKKNVAIGFKILKKYCVLPSDAKEILDVFFTKSVHIQYDPQGMEITGNKNICSILILSFTGNPRYSYMTIQNESFAIITTDLKLKEIAEMIGRIEQLDQEAIDALVDKIRAKKIEIEYPENPPMNIHFIKDVLNTKPNIQIDLFPHFL